MTKQTTSIRRARKSDAADLAILDNLSSHGLSLAFWEQAVLEGEGDDALSIGRRRFMDEGSVFGWRNAIVAEIDGIIVGGLTAYEMTPVEEPSELKSSFADFVPMFALFNQCVGDWFIDSVAVFEPFRRQGIAEKLLRHGIRIGEEQGFEQTSLVVESDNNSAIALYERLHFNEAQRNAFATDANRFWLLFTRRTAPTVN